MRETVLPLHEEMSVPALLCVCGGVGGRESNVSNSMCGRGGNMLAFQENEQPLFDTTFYFFFLLLIETSKQVQEDLCRV